MTCVARGRKSVQHVSGAWIGLKLTPSWGGESLAAVPPMLFVSFGLPRLLALHFSGCDGFAHRLATLP